MNATPESSAVNAGPVFVPIESSSTERVTIPRIEEQLQVGKQTLETGRVRLTKTVHETREAVAIPLLREAYTVERLALHEYVDEVPVTRQEGETTIYSVVNEVLVVQKRLLLVKEIRVTKQQIRHEETQTVQLRREEITVERTAAIPTPERPA
ncbi:YsnF/AvaK domain-containing protein [Spirosoma endophyticum]|uniref:Conserved domain-containing protein n=1 Tax=Spirosoma endophyticum TaxID=662367 RepID=A0A1I2EV10_9BACT|nr:YsnF/AvaK domain-containing protein [Spirosoma endophyticum]SFE96649.1 conserved domain-containing protein [Spirosoma endophyticum]